MATELMTNPIHLWMTPRKLWRLPSSMQSVGRHYMRYVNDHSHRSGTLWEGRYKASLVDCERYVLACYRSIELKPVRAGMVSNPADYRWSS